MKTLRVLDHKDIEQAVIEYLANRGIKIAGKVPETGDWPMEWSCEVERGDTAVNISVTVETESGTVPSKSADAS